MRTGCFGVLHQRQGSFQEEGVGGTKFGPFPALRRVVTCNHSALSPTNVRQNAPSRQGNCMNPLWCLWSGFADLEKTQFFALPKNSKCELVLKGHGFIQSGRTHAKPD